LKDSVIIEDSIRYSNKIKKIREINKEKSLYGIKDLNEILISQSNIGGNYKFDCKILLKEKKNHLKLRKTLRQRRK